MGVSEIKEEHDLRLRETQWGPCISAFYDLVKRGPHNITQRIPFNALPRYPSLKFALLNLVFLLSFFELVFVLFFKNHTILN